MVVSAQVGLDDESRAELLGRGGNSQVYSRLSVGKRLAVFHFSLSPSHVFSVVQCYSIVSYVILFRGRQAHLVCCLGN